MNFNIQDISKSVVSAFCFELMACCMISYDISLKTNPESSVGSYVLVSIAGIVFLGWLIWFFRMYLGDRQVAKLSGKTGRVVEVINWIIFALWITVSFVDALCHPVVLIVAWILFFASLTYYVFE